jgi:hypothetical protein
MNGLRPIILGALLIAGQQAWAATTVTQWGVSAVSAHADCALAFPCNLASLGFGLWFPETHLPAAGGLNQTFASQLDVGHVHDTPLAGTIDMGLTSSQVQLDNTNVGVPVLKAKAQSYDDNGWVSAIAFGIQGYQYTGTEATTIELGVGLNGNIVNPNASDVTGFSIGVWLLRPDPSLAFPAPTVPTLGAFVAAVIASTEVAASWGPLDANATGAVSLSTGNSPLAISLEPGSEFYLMAGLVASATGPATSADAFGTLTMNFVDGSNLVPAGVTPIPEPRIYALLLAGLGLVGWHARFAKRRRLAA